VRADPSDHVHRFFPFLKQVRDLGGSFYCRRLNCRRAKTEWTRIFAERAREMGRSMPL
jgi:hypothetical protein